MTSLRRRVVEDMQLGCGGNLLQQFGNCLHQCSVAELFNPGIWHMVFPFHQALSAEACFIRRVNSARDL